MHVIISDPARADLGAIWDFIAPGSTASADRTTNELIDKALELGEFPLSAAVIAGREADQTRRVNVRSWAILYEVRGDHVEVLRFVQGQSDPSVWF